MVILTAIHGTSLDDEIVTHQKTPGQVFGSYSYMFPRKAESEAETVPFGLTEPDYFDRLDELRKVIEKYVNHTDSRSNMPAAFTYFGQFVNHDMSAPVTLDKRADQVRFDPELQILMSKTRIGDPKNLLKRMANEHLSPLSLNSLYGGGPQSENAGSLYVPGTAQFALGRAFDDPAVSADDKAKVKLAPNSLFDLPRDGRVARIADRRNDENLVISQLHLAFILFHNEVVGHLAEKSPGLGVADLFAEARKIVTKHYQWCILHDFLDREGITPDGAFRGVAPGALKNFKGVLKEPGKIPLEFTTAAFRFGHSTVSAQYDYNGVFSRKNGKHASLPELFLFTSRNGMNGQSPAGGASPQVPTHWIIDWDMFTGKASEGSSSDLINPLLAPTMLDLMEELHPSKFDDGLTSICTRNLRRGYHRFIPSGQTLAAELNIKPLSPQEIRSCFPDIKTADSGTAEKFDDFFSSEQFGSATPAWLYFLCEARAKDFGQTLGPVASAIVGETIIGLLKHNPDSVMNAKGPSGGAWTPKDSEIRAPGGKPVDSLRRILEFAQVVAPVSA
jgi:Animal haem peroxidase